MMTHTELARLGLEMRAAQKAFRLSLANGQDCDLLHAVKRLEARFDRACRDVFEAPVSLFDREAHS